MSFLTILYFIIGLSVLIFFHEFGHFIAAKIFGVYVYEFSLFMGPKIFQFKIGETKYSLRCLPIGGYCSMAGEEDSQAERNEKELEEENKEVKDKKEDDMPEIPPERSMLGIAKWKKLLIMFAGPLFNIILCFFFMLIFYSCGQSSTVNVADNSKAYEVGLRNENHISDFQAIFYDDVIYEDEGKHLQLGYRASNEIESTIVIENIIDETYGAMYEVIKDYDETLETIPSSLNVDFIFKIGENVYTIPTEFNLVFNEDKTELIMDEKYTLEKLGIVSSGSYGLGESISRSFKQEGRMSILIFQSLGKLFTKEGLHNVSGVVGMYRQSKTFMSYGFMYFLYFLALISVNLGIMNLLPFPALDGGRIVLTLIECITKKKASQKVEGILNAVGFILLIGIMILVTIKDIFFV